MNEGTDAHRARDVTRILDEVRDRQVKSARILQAKALEALKNLPPERAIKAATALSIGWKHELLLMGEPTDRTATVEDVIKREYERWMVVGGEGVEEGGETRDGAA